MPCPPKRTGVPKGLPPIPEHAGEAAVVRAARRPRGERDRPPRRQTRVSSLATTLWRGRRWHRSPKAPRRRNHWHRDTARNRRDIKDTLASRHARPLDQDAGRRLEQPSHRPVVALLPSLTCLNCPSSIRHLCPSHARFLSVGGRARVAPIAPSERFGVSGAHLTRGTPYESSRYCETLVVSVPAGVTRAATDLAGVSFSGSVRLSGWHF